MKGIKNIFFDFDGTIADTCEGIVCTVRETRRRMGLPQIDPELTRRSIGLPLRLSLTKGSLIPEDRVEEAASLYHAIFNEIAIPKVTPCPGVCDAVKELYDRGFILGIATSRGRTSLEKILENLHLDKYFSALSSVENAVNPKPAPDLVLYLFGCLGAKPEETLVVGDTCFDLGMGRSAGCRTCGVTYGNHSEDILRAESPDLLIDDMHELVLHLE